MCARILYWTHLSSYLLPGDGIRRFRIRFFQANGCGRALNPVAFFSGQTAKMASGTGRETGCGKNRPEELLYIAADVYYNRQYQSFFISLFRHGRYRYWEFLVTGNILMSGLHMHPGIWPGCFFMRKFRKGGAIWTTERFYSKDRELTTENG